MRFYITFEFKGKTPHYSVYPSKYGNKALWSSGYKRVYGHALITRKKVLLKNGNLIE